VHVHAMVHWVRGEDGARVDRGKLRTQHIELSVAHHGERDKLPTLEHQTGRSYYRRLFFRSSTSCSSSHSQRRKITI
jgi:hypothetical protein